MKATMPIIIPMYAPEFMFLPQKAATSCANPLQQSLHLFEVLRGGDLVGRQFEDMQDESASGRLYAQTGEFTHARRDSGLLLARPTMVKLQNAKFSFDLT